MKKKEMLAAVAQKCGMSEKIVDAVLDGFMEIATDAILRDDKITLMGFGTFEPRTRHAREARNPHDNSIHLHVPERKGVVFKPGNKLRAALNECENKE